MTTIFIFGKKNQSDRLWGYALKTLSQSYCVTSIDDNKAFRCGNGYEVFLTRYEQDFSIEISGSLAIICDDFEGRVHCCKECTVIVNSQNSAQLKKLNRCGCRIISCGYSEKDTFSYSSLTEDSVVISLNREISALSGKKIAPLELPVKINFAAESVFPVIAFTALRFLLDDRNSEIGRLY